MSIAQPYDNEQRFPSTTFGWKRVKITPPAEGQGAQRPKATLMPLLHRRDMRKPLTVVIKYRGGPEAWVEIRARGRAWRRPGYVQVYDLLCDIYGVPPEYR